MKLLRKLAGTTDKERCEVCWDPKAACSGQPYAVLAGTFPESTRMTSVHPIDSRTFCSSNRAELLHTEHPARELREGPLPHWLQCTLKIGGLVEEEGKAFISQLSTLRTRIMVRNL